MFFNEVATIFLTIGSTLSILMFNHESCIMYNIGIEGFHHLRTITSSEGSENLEKSLHVNGKAENQYSVPVTFKKLFWSELRSFVEKKKCFVAILWHL